MKPAKRKDVSPSIEQIKESARGRSVDVLRDVAGIPAEYLDGKHHPCPDPNCGGKDRFSLVDADAGAVLCRHCFSEKNGDFIAAVRHFKAVDLPEALRLIGDYLGTPATATKTTSKTLVGTWVYTNQAGEPLYRVKRFEWTENGTPEKQFSQERYKNDRWIAGLKDIKSTGGVPLHWPELIRLADEPVYIIEGETCCDALTAFGLLATTASGGSSTKINWSKYIPGRKVVILPDNDKPGFEYALRVADQLHGGNEIKVVFLPGLNHKEDVADWIERGGTKDELVRIVKETPLWDGKPFAYNGGADQPDTPAKSKKNSTVSFVPKLINPQLVESKPIAWLWENKIPLEMITVIAGRQGGGENVLVLLSGGGHHERLELGRRHAGSQGKRSVFLWRRPD